MKIGLTEKMQRIDKEISQNGLPSPMKPWGAYLMSPNQGEPMKYRLQNKNWSCIKRNYMQTHKIDFMLFASVIKSIFNNSWWCSLGVIPRRLPLKKRI